MVVMICIVYFDDFIVDLSLVVNIFCYFFMEIVVIVYIDVLKNMFVKGKINWYMYLLNG